MSGDGGGLHRRWHGAESRELAKGACTVVDAFGLLSLRPPSGTDVAGGANVAKETRDPEVSIHSAEVTDPEGSGLELRQPS
jgi:hypothetical protein